MSIKPSKTLVGAFVLGAITLAVVGLMTFGAGRYFSNQPTYVMFFDGTVKGLNSGAPVMFKGVKVGAVSDIRLRFNPETKSVQIAVLAEINPHSITNSHGKINAKAFLNELIKQGLKAQLQYQNLLTGQLVVSLDFHSGKPAKLTKSGFKYPEIPTIPSSIEEFTKTIEKLPLGALVNKLTSAIEGMEKAATSPELMKSIHNMNLALEDMRRLVETINSNVEPIASDMRGVLTDSRTMVQNFDKHSSSLQSGIEETAEAARLAMVQAEKTFKAVEHASSGDSPAMYQLSQALERISEASDSLRTLSDYISRHPEALLHGKKDFQGE
jgi:paraquat-inducible protein B